MGGFEPPTHGFSVLCRKNTNPDKTKTCETTKEQLTPKTQKQGKNDTQNLPADLAEIIAVWPQLPEAIRSAIVAIVRSLNEQ